jgi:hypothetical protein
MQIRLITAVLLFSCFSSSPGAGFFLDVEGGMAFPGYNDVQVPNDGTGTRFSLTGVLDVEPEFIYRLRAGMTTGKHTFFLFAAPLRLEGTGTLDETVEFAGSEFQAGETVDGLYRFDSYRLTWRYLLMDSNVFSFSGGLTAKIRDAEIRLESGGRSAFTDNTGFVPLLSFDLRWRPGCHPVSLLLEGDALVGPQGRAEDVFLGVLYSPSSRIDLRTGYRIVEGGADVESVYNFTMVSFVTAGITCRI